MKSEYLLKNLNSVDDKFVNEIYSEMYASSRKRRRGINWGALAAGFAIVICGTAAMLGNIGAVEESSLTLMSNRCDVAMAENMVVMIDVNPGISLMVNDRGVVVELNAENEDGEAISGQLNVVGKDCNTAVTETVTVLQQNGYITELKNSMLITVLDRDADKAENMRESLVSSVCTYAESMDYGISILSQIMDYDDETASVAEQYSISGGKALLLEKICDKYSDLDLETLAANNIQTINQLFEYTELPALVYRIGNAAGVVPSDYIEKLGLDQLASSDLLSFTSAVSDFYDKLCEYYETSDVAQHIGYVFDIVEASSADGETLWALFAESIKGTHSAIINIGESSISDWFTPDKTNQVKDFIYGIIDAA